MSAILEEAVTVRVLLAKRVLIEKGFAKFTEKHLCQSLSFDIVAGLRVATLLKKRVRHRYFPVSLQENLFDRTLPANCFCALNFKPYKLHL